MLTQDRLKSVLRYDQDTGEFYWVSSLSNIAPSGSVAGCKRKIGYTYICIDGKQYRAHRLAWLYMTGKFPENVIDHIDNDGHNNKWGNLREATLSGNAARRIKAGSSGIQGAVKSGNRWRSSILIDGVRMNLGSFSTPQEAHEKYTQAANKFRGEFSPFWKG